MSWDSIFTNVENLLRIIILIGPLIEFIETLFKKVFPGEKTGVQKKAMAMLVGRVIIPPEVTDEEFSDLVDGYVDLKNKDGEFFHTNPRVDLQMTGL